jgi:ribose transport system permease protein
MRTAREDPTAVDKRVAAKPPRNRSRTLPIPLTRVAERYALLAAWVGVIVLFSILLPHTFLTAADFESILGSQAVLVVLALGLLVPLTAGDYDLSVAAILTMSSMTVAVLNAEQGVPIGWAVAAALGVGIVSGAINGGLIVVLGLDAFIVTLGTATILSGLTLWISASNTIGNISQTLINVVIVDRFLGVPLEFYYGLGLCILFWYAFEHLPIGRRLLFVGRGRRVARLSGLNVGRLRWAAFIVSGLISALAGVMYAGTTGAADPTSGASFLLPAYAAVFLGATSITPGRFNAWGTIIAVYFLVTGITGLQLLGVQTFVQQLFYGGALIIGVALSRYASHRSAKATVS